MWKFSIENIYQTIIPGSLLSSKTPQKLSPFQLHCLRFRHTLALRFFELSLSSLWLDIWFYFLSLSSTHWNAKLFNRMGEFSKSSTFFRQNSNHKILIFIYYQTFFGHKIMIKCQHCKWLLWQFYYHFVLLCRIRCIIHTIAW